MLTEKDVIRAHARDELGIDIDELANPLQVPLAVPWCHCCSVPAQKGLFGCGTWGMQALAGASARRPCCPRPKGIPC